MQHLCNPSSSNILVCAPHFNTDPVAYLHPASLVWDPQIAHVRAAYIKIILATVVSMILVMWLALPVYWGSLAETSEHVPNLKGKLQAQIS